MASGGFKSQKQQQGIVAVFVSIALLAIIGIVGMALDFSHLMVNRARLQNSLDAAAISGAKVLKTTSSQTLATDAARKIFRSSILLSANQQLIEGGADESDLLVEFSDTLNPFNSSASALKYVRVRMNSELTYATWFISVFGVADLHIKSSAVAGPSPTLGEACNIAPFVICGDESDPPTYGYELGEDVVLKRSTNSDVDELGPGNFQLVRLEEDDAGGKDVRENLASSNGGCVQSGETIETEPGNTVGPVAQGLNVRFGIYLGPISEGDYPPDKVTQPGSYADYMDVYNSDNPLYDEPDGVAGRRIMAVPVTSCTGMASGNTTLDVFDNMLCIFLTEPAVQAGNEQEIHAQVIDSCQTEGVPGPAPDEGPGPTTIQLYGDPDRWDS
jgi:hypothetical protein